MLYSGRSQRRFGAPVVLFLIVEPSGLARLWQIAKQKLRTWPFPYRERRRSSAGAAVLRAPACLRLPLW